METNNVTEEKELSPEEIEAAYQGQLKEFDRQIVYFKKQLELEQLHRDIADARLKTTVARAQLASFLAPPEEDDQDTNDSGEQEKHSEQPRRRNLKTQ